MTVTEITREQLHARMEKTDLKKRNIGQFCGYYIYNDVCKIKNCRRMHTLNLDFIQEYLGDDNNRLKSVECEKLGHCPHFLCRWGHSQDHIIFGRSDPEDPDATFFEYSEEERAQARSAWKAEKHDAYMQELLTGQRQPKNKREEEMLEQYRINSMSNPNNFPALGNTPPIQHPIPVWGQVPIQPLEEVVVESQEVQQIEIVPETIQEEQPKFSLEIINGQFNSLYQFFNSYPAYLQDPMVYNLFQLACNQYEFMNM